jgi:hypothetical protein
VHFYLANVFFSRYIHCYMCVINELLEILRLGSNF